MTKTTGNIEFDRLLKLRHMVNNRQCQAIRDSNWDVYHKLQVAYDALSAAIELLTGRV